MQRRSCSTGMCSGELPARYASLPDDSRVSSTEVLGRHSLVPHQKRGGNGEGSTSRLRPFHARVYYLAI